MGNKKYTKPKALRMRMRAAKCLKCDRKFRSQGNWNRLCAKCNWENESIIVPRALRMTVDDKETA